MSENQHEGKNALSVRSPVVDEEGMKPGHWLGSVLCVLFSVVTVQEGHHQVAGCSTDPEWFCHGAAGGPRGNWLV